MFIFIFFHFNSSIVDIYESESLQEKVLKLFIRILSSSIFRRLDSLYRIVNEIDVIKENIDSDEGYDISLNNVDCVKGHPSVDL